MKFTTPHSKKCSKCNIEKKVSEFYKQKTGKYGLRSHCKECIKIYRNNHKDTIQQYRNNHRHERQQYRKKYYQNNKWKEQQQNKEYRKTHTEQILNKKNQRTKKRYQSDFTFKYRMRISQGLQKAFKSIHYSKNGISIDITQFILQ